MVVEGEPPIGATLPEKCMFEKCLWPWPLKPWPRKCHQCHADLAMTNC